MSNLALVDPSTQGYSLKEYLDLIKSKVKVAPVFGVEVPTSRLFAEHFPHQRDAVQWALRRGRALIAMSFGLGKTRIQCDIARLLVALYARPVLVTLPLGVKHQFEVEDGPVMGVTWTYVKTTEEALAQIESGNFYLITNYERVRDGQIDPRLLNLIAALLDEGSVLRNMGSKTSDVFRKVFADVPYRYVATATPAPNNYKEIIYYAEWLGITDTGRILTQYFERNPDKAGDLKLIPQWERAFWMWVSSWALFLYSPSDLGYDDTAYVLPERHIHWHRVEADYGRAQKEHDSWGQHYLLADTSASVLEANRESRATIPQRVAKMREIVEANPDKHWLLWHFLEDERKAIEKAVTKAVTVYGSQKLELREERILQFAHGELPILATKPVIAGSGCNFQRHCHSAIFVGLDPNSNFQNFIQAVHRIYRFQQTEVVDIHIIYPESQEVLKNLLEAKWQQYNELTEVMRDIIRKYGLDHAALQSDMQRQLGVERREIASRLFTLIHNDCVLELDRMPSDSVALILTSIPFGNHYEYTINLEDFGHNLTDDDFWVQMDYLICRLYRVLEPGRMAIIHVKDRVLYGHQTSDGTMEVSPFMAETIMAFKKHGFKYMGLRTITTDVVRENNSSYRLSYTEMTNDSTKQGCGLPEYTILFRKPPTSNQTARADRPVRKNKSEYSIGKWQINAHAHWHETHKAPYDYEVHVARLDALEAAGNLPKKYFCEPPPSNNPYVWTDINFMRNLNAAQHLSGKTNHICPLPFDIVERNIELYSEPGDLVLDPFSGLGTVPYAAIKMGRLGMGIELNPEYFACAVGYCEAIEQTMLQTTLFDAMGVQVA